MLAAIDRTFGSRSLIFADVSSDPTYAEVLFGMFQPRFIGVQITRNSSGMEPRQWQLKNGHVLV